MTKVIDFAEFKKLPEFTFEYQEELLMEVLGNITTRSGFQNLGYVMLQLSQKDSRFLPENGFTEEVRIRLLFSLAVANKIELRPKDGHQQIKLYSKPDCAIHKISSARRTANIRWGISDLPKN
jgi:hypothetical protein